MLKRIPHTDLEIIAGQETTREYLKMQERMGRFYLKGFIKHIRNLKKSGEYLEIGPGPGYQTCQIAHEIKNIKIKALEYSQDMVSVANEYKKKERAERKNRVHSRLCRRQESLEQSG